MNLSNGWPDFGSIVKFSITGAVFRENFNEFFPGNKNTNISWSDFAISLNINLKFFPSTNFELII